MTNFLSAKNSYPYKDHEHRRLTRSELSSEEDEDEGSSLPPLSSEEELSSEEDEDEGSSSPPHSSPEPPDSSVEGPMKLLKKFENLGLDDDTDGDSDYDEKVNMKNEQDDRVDELLSDADGFLKAVHEDRVLFDDADEQRATEVLIDVKRAYVTRMNEKGLKNGKKGLFVWQNILS